MLLCCTLFDTQSSCQLYFLGRASDSCSSRRIRIIIKESGWIEQKQVSFFKNASFNTLHPITLSYFSDARNERGPVVIDKRQQDDNLRPDNLRPDTGDLSTRILHFSYIGLAILGEYHTGRSRSSIRFQVDQTWSKIFFKITILGNDQSATSNHPEIFKSWNRPLEHKTDFIFLNCALLTFLKWLWSWFFQTKYLT